VVGAVAWVGLTPRGRGTGGKHRSGGISKQGDRTLRSLLIDGANSYLRQQIARGVKDPWQRDLLARQPYKGVMVAFAAKNARITWALLTKGEGIANAPPCRPPLDSGRHGGSHCRKGQIWRDGKRSGTGIETLRVVIARNSASE